MKIFKKEKEVVGLALNFLDLATRCVTSGESAVLAYLNGDLTEASAAQQETGKLEAEADAARREIGDRLFSGAYLPLIRGDIHSIIDFLDKMPNAAEACCGFFLSEKPKVPEEFRQRFIEVTKESFGSMENLRKAVKAFFKPKGDIGKIRENVCEVSVQESRVDDLEWELTLAIFENEEIDLCHQRHMKVALDKIAHLADVAEDVADRLELTAIKSVI